MQVDYQVLSNNSIDNLVTEVNMYLNKGYILAGGVSSVIKDNRVYSNSSGVKEITPNKFEYYQAVYLEKDEKDTI